MERPFYLFQELADVVQAQPRPQRAEIARLHHKAWGSLAGAPGVQPQAQVVVHGLLERLSRPLDFRLQLGGDIVINRQSGSHTLMLYNRHPDVNQRRAGHDWLALPRANPFPPFPRSLRPQR